MPLSFMDATVTVSRAPLANERGAQVPDWARARSHAVKGCLVTAAATSQDRDGRVVQVHDRLTLRAPYGSDIRAGDRVTVDGTVYEVDGDPLNAKSPTGRASTMRCALALWKG